ncbi:RNA exonuclease 3 [Cryptotrichosporon argae]
MFRSLGLLADEPCPDKDCRRVNCLLKHGSSSKPAPARVTPVAAAAASKPRPAVANPVKRGVDAASPVKRQTDAAPTIDKRPKLDPDERKPVVGPSARALTASKTMSSSRLSAPQQTFTPGRPPVIPPGKAAPQPIADRTKALQTLFTQYTNLYAPILSSHPELAHESALAQEAEISAGSPNLRAYKTAIHHAAVNISRRPAPDSRTHPSVGTVKEARAATEAVERAAAGQLTAARVAPYRLALDDFAKWRYPDPRNAALTDPPVEPNAEGTEQTCERCKVPFVVLSRELDQRLGECTYHYGRPVPERVEGKRKWVYTCCKRERGSAGCEDGVHVFAEKDDDAALARRVAYRTTEAIADELRAKGLPVGDAEVVGMDCEMIYTTAGLSLARVTVVDANGGLLIDEFVRQTVPVLDVNTRFSGLTLADLARAVLDLPAARAAVGGFVGPSTVVVGHGLENDLRALRLLHSNVVDTAIVFPHDRGHPYRRALRDIVKEKLGYFIQDRTADLGHSSAEDARATLDVLRAKVREDAE